MSVTVFLVSVSTKGHVNLGAYDRPFSGVGIEFEPLGLKPGRTGITLHESGFLPANDRWNFPAVFSPFWRLFYNGSRGHCVLFGERIVELTPEHLMLIPDHCQFHCLGKNPVPTFWVHFSFTRKLHPSHTVPVLLPPRQTELCLIQDLQELIRADVSWDPNEAIYRNSLALLQVVIARPELRWQPPVPENLVRVQQLIEGELASDLAAPLLARKAGLSVTSLNRAFRQHFDTSPARYVTEMRVREAAKLLLQTDASIDAIAEQTGFPNRAHLSRVFKQVTGAAPAGFRRQHRREGWEPE
jgi:AraC family transcriptional regulator, arabinose operon regulatory protein